MDEQGCVPIKLYLETLKCECHTVFTCHTILLSLIFFPDHLKNAKPILDPGLHSSRLWARFGLKAIVLIPIQHCLKTQPRFPEVVAIWEKIKLHFLFCTTFEKKNLEGQQCYIPELHVLLQTLWELFGIFDISRDERKTWP